MKKMMALLVVVALLGGCSNQPESVSEENKMENQETNVEVNEETEISYEASYQLKTDTYENEENSISIDYLVMEGFAGELTQDYINQSFASIIDSYSNNDSYKKVQISSEVNMATDEYISVVYTGSVTLDDGRTVEVLHPVNIDVVSSNQITFEELFNDVESVKALVGEKVVSEGLSDVFEAEEIRIYMNEEKIFFAYMPLDDSSTNFIKVSLDRSDLSTYINTDFGSHPSS